ncbi:MAG: hypothetical protein A2Y65_12895 [Deltaproteobacteria bacterium RBG_13_52_11]|nr:MAG: hypothetical protein A2Y65_12895 [Deltaproteobacteria bacterium RBG_13_52_11]
MWDFVDKVFFLIVGISMILFRKLIVRQSLKWGSGIFGFNIFRLKLHKKEEDLSRYITISNTIIEFWFLIVGSILVVFNLLLLFDIIHLRQ